MAETLNQYKSNLTSEEVDQALHNIAQLDDGIAQAKQYADQAQGYAESINPGNFYTKEQADAEFAPKSHNSASGAYGIGNGTVYGHVKLSDAAGSDDAAKGVAATPKAVQEVMKLAEEARSRADTSVRMYTHQEMGNMTLQQLDGIASTGALAMGVIPWNCAISPNGDNCIAFMGGWFVIAIAAGGGGQFKLDTNPYRWTKVSG